MQPFYSLKYHRQVLIDEDLIVFISEWYTILVGNFTTPQKIICKDLFFCACQRSAEQEITLSHWSRFISPQ